jgi:hypothetical protein
LEIGYRGFGGHNRPFFAHASQIVDRFAAVVPADLSFQIAFSHWVGTNVPAIVPLGTFFPERLLPGKTGDRFSQLGQKILKCPKARWPLS